MSPSLAPAEFWIFREASGARRFESKASFVSAKFSTTVPGRIECVRKMLVLADLYGMGKHNNACARLRASRNATRQELC